MAQGAALSAACTVRKRMLGRRAPSTTCKVCDSPVTMSAWPHYLLRSVVLPFAEQQGLPEADESARLPVAGMDSWTVCGARAWPRDVSAASGGGTGPCASPSWPCFQLAARALKQLRPPAAACNRPPSGCPLQPPGQGYCWSALPGRSANSCRHLTMVTAAQRVLVLYAWRPLM